MYVCMYLSLYICIYIYICEAHGGGGDGRGAAQAPPWNNMITLLLYAILIYRLWYNNTNIE